MKVTKRGKTLTITLSPESTIIEVENDTDKLRSIPDGIEKINLKLDALEEMDTAYFQLLLALKQTAEQKNITLHKKGNTYILNELSELYGISL